MAGKSKLVTAPIPAISAPIFRIIAGTLKIKHCVQELHLVIMIFQVYGQAL